MNGGNYILSLLLLLFSFQANSQTPDWQWVQDFRSGSDEEVLDIATDPATGETYSVGYFEGNMQQEFPFNLNGTPTMNAPLGTRDGWVGKHDVYGNPIWGFRIGSALSIVEVHGVDIDAAGDIYITGFFNGIGVNFAGIQGSPNDSKTSINEDAFIAKYDSFGNLVWVETTSGGLTSNERGTDICTGPNGIYVTGFYEANMTWNGTAFSHLGGGNQDAFIAKFTPAGACSWGQTAGANAGGGFRNQRGLGICANASNVFVTGVFFHSINVGGLPVLNNYQSAGNTRDIWVASINETNGAAVWRDRIGSTAGDEGTAIAADNGKLYLTGSVQDNGTAGVNFPGLAPIPTGDTDEEIFLARMDATSGTTDWVNIEITPESNECRGQDVIVDGTNQLVYVTGYWDGAVQMNGGPIFNSTSEDVIVYARTTAGVYQWTQTAQSGSNEAGNAVAYDNFTGVFVGGRYEILTNFGSLTVPSGGGTNGFTGRLADCDAVFAYPKNTFCINFDAPTAPTTTPDPGGTYSSTPAGLTLNSADGTITASTSTAGAYTVTYTAPNQCQHSENITIANNCWEWGDSPETGNYEASNSVAVDNANGFVYVGGILNSGGVYPDITGGEIAGGSDGFVAKYAIDGTYQWAFNIGGSNNDEVTGVAVDESTGRIYVTGYINGTFGSEMTSVAGHIVGVDNGQISASAGQDDIFVACYEPTGALVWKRTGGSAQDDHGLDITLNGNGVYLIGYYDDVATFDTETTALPSNTSRNYAILAYDKANGNIQWDMSMGTGSDDWDNGFNHQQRDCGITCDNDSIYTIFFVRGATTNIYDVTNTPVGSETETSGSGSDMIVAGFDDAGNYAWSEIYDDNTGDDIIGCDIAVDCDGVYIVGALHNGVTTPGGMTIISGHDGGILARLNRSTGAEEWAIELVSNQNDTDVPIAVHADGYGNVYVAGIAASNPLQIENPAVFNTSTINGDDAFVMRYQNDGTFVDIEIIDGGNTDWATDVNSYENEKIVLTGITNDGITFPPLNFPSGNSENIFIAVKPVTPVGAGCCLGPSIVTCQNDTTVTSNGACNYVMADMTVSSVANDDCGSGGVTLSQSILVGTNLPAGDTLVWIIATDNNGDKDSCSFTLTVAPPVNPTVVNCGDLLLGETTFNGTNNQDTWTCSPDITGGEDIYYQITVPVGNYLLGTQITNASDGNENKIHVRWVDGSCPTTSTCVIADEYNIAQGDFDSNNQNQLLFNAVGPGTFWFVVDAVVDHIDQYDIEFNCIVSGVEFDEDGCGSDTDNDGVYTTVDGSVTLEVEPCETVTVCNEIYVQNVNAGEWMDTVLMELGPCYTNLTNFTPNGPGANGFHTFGTWNAVVDVPNNSIEWGYDYQAGPELWGDGPGAFYNCATYEFCFDTDISSSCLDDDSLKINIYIEDDAVDGAVPGVSQGFDYAFSDSIYLNLSDPGWNYGGTTSWCQSETDPAATITGTSGGTFFSTAGLVWFDQPNGIIDLSASTPGNYNVTYSVGLCPTDSIINVTITPTDDPTFTYANTVFCNNDANEDTVSTATPGGTFSASSGGLSVNATSGQIDPSASTPGVYKIYYLTPAGPCQEIDSVEITINAEDDPFFDYPQAAYCQGDADPVATNVATSGGTFSGPAQIIFLSTSTGLLDLSASTAGGPYTITYTTAGTCPNSTTFDVTINAEDDPFFDYPQAAYCQGDADPVATNVATGGGTFSGPAQISFLNTSTGLIDLSSSTVGGPYTITYTTTGTCPNSTTFNVTINAEDDPFFDYPQSAYCQGDADPAATNIATGGGTFSGPAQIIFLNTSTGLIDLSASTVGGPYTITHTTAGTCPNATTFNVTINAEDDPFFDYPQVAYCQGDVDPVATNIATGGGTFSGPAQITFLNTSTGEIDLSASTAGGPYTINYTTAGTCPNSTTFNITINVEDDPTFNYSAINYCENDPDQDPIFEATPGGTYAASSGALDIDSGDGEVEIDDSSPGNYTIYYTTSGTCPNIDSVVFNIFPEEDPTFDYPQNSYCQADADPVATNVATGGGTFSAPAQIVFLNTTTGEIDLSASTAGGPYTISYSTPGFCSNTTTFDITINAEDDPFFDYPQAAYCQGDANPVATNVATGGGTFTAPPQIVFLNPSTGEINLTASTAGGPYTITHTTSGACPNVATFNITINAEDDPFFDYPQSIYCQAEVNPVATNVANGSGTFTGPPALIFLNNSTGLIDLSASTPGGPYTIDYTTTGTCPNSNTFDITIVAEEDPSISYLNTVFCNNDSNEDTLAVGTNGGGFTTSNPGIIVDGVSGEISVAASTPGVYQIYYTTPGPLCQNIDSVEITINPNEDATFSYAQSGYCQADVNPTPNLTGTSGGTYTESSGNVSLDGAGAIDLMASLPGTYWIIYNTPGPICPDVDSVQITIYPEDDPSFSYAQTVFCNYDANEDTLSVGTSGGTFSTSSVDLNVDANTGTINVAASNPGIFMIYYNTAGPDCPNTDSTEVTINAVDDPTFNYNAEYCQTDANPVPNIQVPGGVFSALDPEIIFASADGTIDIGASTPGADLQIQYVTPGICPDSSVVLVTIWEAPIADAGVDQNLDFEFETNMTALTPSSGSGVWLLDNGAGIFSDDSDPITQITDLEVGTNTFIWTVSNGSCPDASDQMIIEVKDIWVPEALTPNGDGLNDYFEIKGIQNAENEVQIFNRWGQMIFQTSDYQNDWEGLNENGVEMANDTYFYVITLNGDRTLKGFVVLQR